MSEEKIDNSEMGLESEDVNTQESGVSSFSDLLPEELKGDPSLQDFKDIGGLAKSYISAQKMLGKSIRIPGEDASEEARAEFYKKLTEVPDVYYAAGEEGVESLYNQLGRPESPEKYKIEVEGAELNPEALGEFTKMAHKIGLTNKQVNEIARYEAEHNKQMSEAMEKQAEEDGKKLREIWGPEYDNRLNMAKAVLNQYADKYPDHVQQLIESNAANNPALLAMISELGKSVLEESSVASNGSSRSFGLTPEEAQEQYNEILSNMSHPYWDGDHPGHEQAVSKAHKLKRIASSE